MKKKFILILTGFFLISISLLLSVNQNNISTTEVNKQIPDVSLMSGAGQAMDMWSFERAYPYDKIPTSKFIEAFAQKRQAEQQRAISIDGEWENMGPKNIGGRTLCLAFHPTNEDIMFAGSASGGLWKTTTQGVGEDAWEYVPTGFPVLGVAAIAIDSDNPDIIYIGTGETYGVGYAEPGTMNRLTRGTYGIGILKTEDGGATWSQVLQFDMDEIKGIQEIVINPMNTQEIYAAATDGLFQSLDGGASWNLILNESNCIDVEIDPNNDAIIYVTRGNLNLDLDPSLSGIYKSIDKGISFIELVDPGLLTAWSGNAKITLDPINPNIIYASIQATFTPGNTMPAGIYKSIDAGVIWTYINDQIVASWQGWYSHDIVINPESPNELMYVGIAAWKSTNNGENFTQKTEGTLTVGEVPVAIPEGADNYVHSDIHAVYYHPINNKVFMASDGGVYVSNDGELPFTTLNGGLQTLQFYADMGSSATNPNYCIGGTQDFASYIYKGNPSWWRVIGGDGMSAAVNQEDDQKVFGSLQRLGMYKSIDNGLTFEYARPTLVTDDFVAFSAPYELAPTNQEIMYAAGTYLYKSLDGGINWEVTSETAVDVNPIMNIAISPFNPNIVYVSTSPDPSNGPTGAKIFKSLDSGLTFTELTNGLPDRICKDLEFDPSDENVLYATFSGFGSDHVFKTTDAGANWYAIDNGLPDVPTNTILIDELNPEDIYVGNDLGVYYSENGGGSWEVFSDELPEAVMIYDLNNSPANRKIRIATHGHGMYQRNYVNDFLAVDEIVISNTKISIYPNPVQSNFILEGELSNSFSEVSLSIFNLQGKEVKSIDAIQLIGKNLKEYVDISNLNSGVYLFTLRNGINKLYTGKIIKE